MAVRIRMSRVGRTNSPFYRIGVYDSRTPRNGRCLEKLGWYDPTNKDPKNELCIDLEKAERWLSVGALPTPKMAHLLKRAGIVVFKPTKKSNKPKTSKSKNKVKGRGKGKAKAKKK